VPGFGAATGYAELLTAPALAALRPSIDGLGPWIPSLLQATPAVQGAADPRPRAGDPAPWLAAARALGFAIHAYTLRPEPANLLLDTADQPIDDQALLRRLAAVGVTGAFTDAPGRSVEARSSMASPSPP